jgi:putative transposase
VSGPAGYNSGNSRNGSTTKTISGEFGEIEVETPRDRKSSFEPQILGKHQRRWGGFDDKILSMYARGMTMEAVKGWRNRALESRRSRHVSHLSAGR